MVLTEDYMQVFDNSFVNRGDPPLDSLLETRLSIEVWILATKIDIGPPELF